MAGLAVTVTVQSTSAAVVSPAMVHALIDYVRSRRYDSDDGALGIRGRLATDELKFDYAGKPVRVVFGESALAVREALLSRRPDHWLVIVTERDEADLGAGVLSHFVGQQLRSPDPWQAVRQRFGAIAIDAQLLAGPGHREIAIGLLESMPATGWPAAPAGLLTRDHAFGSVARSLLDLPEGPIDLVSILGWTTRPSVTRQLAELRRVAADPLADAVVRWIGGAAGDASSVVTTLLSAGRPADIVPIGLVVGFLGGERSQRQLAEVALARISHHWSGASDEAVRLLGDPSVTVTATLLTDARRRADAERAITQADGLVREAQADDLASTSPLLRSGLAARFSVLADALMKATATDQGAVERAWRALRQHLLSEGDVRMDAFEAAVRLTRWMASDAGEPAPAGLAALARRQLEVDGWVDAAVNDAAAGAGDDHLGQALGQVLARTRTIRDAHDVEFAIALTHDGVTTEAVGAYLKHEGGRTYPLELLLADVVIPLTKQSPVLLLILDGLSTGVCVEILDDILNQSGSRWAEQLLPGNRRRAAGLSVLPSITEVSRASLLSGKLVRGQQAAEATGYAALTTAYGLDQASLFHKKGLDTIRPGFSVADDVRTAIDDPEQRLVSCVLNTIDDSLDRNDPAGTQWHAKAVKHLQPLLERARDAGRTVVITSDHGHVVDRRQGTPRIYAGVSGPARHRLVTSDIQSDEVVARGDRVLTPGGAAVLAVSERLRYGPLKAGYHGGAAPAEVIVPLVVLVPVELAQSDAVELAPPQQPTWWFDGPDDTQVSPAPAKTSASSSATPTLFDEPSDVDVSTKSGTTQDDARLGQAIIGSAVYRDQLQLAGRLVLTDDRLAVLIDRLAAAPQHRLTALQTAAALNLAPTKMTGAFEQLRKVLNVEGYSVISREPATGTMTLDLTLAHEQFGVAP